MFSSSLLETMNPSTVMIILLISFAFFEFLWLFADCAFYVAQWHRALLAEQRESHSFSRTVTNSSGGSSGSGSGSGKSDGNVSSYLINAENEPPLLSSMVSSSHDRYAWQENYALADDSSTRGVNHFHLNDICFPNIRKIVAWCKSARNDNVNLAQVLANHTPAAVLAIAKSCGLIPCEETASQSMSKR